ncbi:MAG: hypothetical protein H6819_09555 [Phycisphaerales bacterium]|nr:hypothetical protein [Phycisphaerales bacterium]MCB9855470.1 hypothetical protein [Phycisphaerales bacterium]MCB9864247.1 hypothetical protein [Phycisphaerales bacterium]
MCTACTLLGCSTTAPWPDSPLYEPPSDDPSWQPPESREDAMASMAGRYAHYDIVAYDGETPNGPLSTFVISYGFTDLVIEDGELVEYDRFCHAEYKANQPFVTTFPDEATQAIQPRSAVVDVYHENGAWKIRRPATPTLIGIDGDPDQPLTNDPHDPLINDDDNDGKPGVTVFVTLYGLIEGEIYIARREIFQNEMTLYADGSLQGVVIDDSEQLVLGASLDLLNTPNNPDQWGDLGLSPIILVPIPADIDTCEELMAMRDSLFPAEPGF